MRIRDVLAGVFFGAVLSGCTAVLSTHPVGEQPLVLVAEEWDGTWSDSEDFLEIRVVDAEAGRLEAAWIETGSEGFDIERVEVFLRLSGETIFANVLEIEGDDDSDSESEGSDSDDEDSDSDGEGVEQQYAFFRLAREGGKLVLWEPEFEAFKALVEAGKLPGMVTEGGDVMLEALSAEQLDLLSSDESAGLWQWTEPGTLVRTEGR